MVARDTVSGTAGAGDCGTSRAHLATRGLRIGAALREDGAQEPEHTNSM